jgi:hypothetical protein
VYDAALRAYAQGGQGEQAVALVKAMGCGMTRDIDSGKGGAKSGTTKSNSATTSGSDTTTGVAADVTASVHSFDFALAACETCELSAAEALQMWRWQQLSMHETSEHSAAGGGNGGNGGNIGDGNGGHDDDDLDVVIVVDEDGLTVDRVAADAASSHVSAVGAADSVASLDVTSSTAISTAISSLDVSSLDVAVEDVISLDVAVDMHRVEAARADVNRCGEVLVLMRGVGVPPSQRSYDHAIGCCCRMIITANEAAAQGALSKGEEEELVAWADKTMIDHWRYCSASSGIVVLVVV